MVMYSGETPSGQVRRRWMAEYREKRAGEWRRRHQQRGVDLEGQYPLFEHGIGCSALRGAGAVCCKN